MKQAQAIAKIFAEQKKIKPRLKPLLKWAGGKAQELKYILPNLPNNFDNFYEPFVGGGAVYTALDAKEYFINDKSNELINLYKILASKNREIFFSTIYRLNENWQKIGLIFSENNVLLEKTYQNFSKGILTEEQLYKQIELFVNNNKLAFKNLFKDDFSRNTGHFLAEIQKNLFRKMRRMYVLEQQKGKLPQKDVFDNLETALRSAFYMYLRYFFNLPKKELTPVVNSILFLFIRNFAYSGMFRYNSKGIFNVPYGGIAYNRKNFKKKIDYLKSSGVHELLKKTRVENLDFEAFLIKHPPTKNDFIFLDPPYDSEFSTYAQNDFGKKDQERLADFLINKCEAKWMMIIKKTDFIYDLYADKGLNLSVFDKKYLVSFMNRNNKETEHLMIRNY